MSIDWRYVRFLDSAQFMASSLEKLAANLTPEKKVYTSTYLKERFPTLTNKEIMSITEKGIFPYSYFDNVNKLDLEGLPPIEEFKNDFTGADMDKNKYIDAVGLFARLGFKTFREWLILYQTLDVKLLMDIWLSFR